MASAQIQNCQGTSAHGAIAIAPIRGSSDANPAAINPYFANYGVRALIAGGGSYLPMAKAWLIWYMDHANWPDYNGLNGSVYDYTANPATCALSIVTKNGHPYYDSTDAYAATWLSAMKAYAVADPEDSAWLRSTGVSQRLSQIAQAAVSTMTPNGLMNSAPDHQVQYLMDNVEVYQGLQDYAWLLDHVVQDAAAASQWGNRATEVGNGIENSLFADAVQAPGATPMYGWGAPEAPPSWSNCYPDAIAQLWTVWARLGPTSRRQATWAAYKVAYPGWTATTPAYPDISCPHHDTEAGAAYAAAMVGDKAAVDTWLVGSQTNWVDSGRPYPWVVGDSGFRAMAAQQASTLKS